MEKQLRILFIPLILFAVFFLTAGWLNRFSSDDFEFLFRYRELGFTGSVGYFYDHWNTRWLAIGFMNVVFKLTAFTGSLLSYHVLSLSLLWFSMFRVCKSILQVPSIYMFTLSGFGVIAFFYSCYSIPDVFFWVNTSTMYLYGSIAFFFALAELLNKKNCWISYLVLCLSGFYLGGAYEPLVFTSMIASVCLLIYMFYNNGPSTVSRPLVLKTIIFLSVLMIAFAVSYAGQGHVIRASFLPQTTIAFKLWVLVKAIIKMLLIYLPAKFIVAIPLSVQWFLLGIYFPVEKLTGKFVMLATAGLLILVVISMAPLAFVMSEMGPERAWTQVSIYVVLYSALVATWLGSKYADILKSYKFVPGIITVIAIFIITTGFLAVRQDWKYSQAFDKRIATLNSMKFQNISGVISLEELPETKWLHSSEISNDTTHFTNLHLKKYFQLDFAIKKAEATSTLND